MKKLFMLGLLAMCTMMTGCNSTRVIGEVYKNLFLDGDKKQDEVLPHELESDNKDGKYRLISTFENARRTKNGLIIKQYANLENISTGNQITILLSATTIPHYFINFPEEVVFNLTFQDDLVATWDILDANTLESISHLDYDEFFMKYNQNPNYFPVVNLLPRDIVYLSELSTRESYNLLLHLDEDGKYIIPRIINDTDVHVAAVYITHPDQEYKESDIEYYTNKYIDDVTYTLTNHSTVKIAWRAAEVEDVVEEPNCIKLCEFESGTVLSVYGQRYFFNDTEHAITITAETLGKTLILQPNEVGDIIWTAESIRISN